MRQPPTLSPLPWSATRHLLVLGLVVVALFHGTIGAIVDPGVLGWRPDHGHLGHAARAPHAHPWDDGHVHEQAPAGAETSASSPLEVVFTAAADGMPSVAGVALPVSVLMLALLGAVFALARPPASRPPAYAPAIAVPPPRG